MGSKGPYDEGSPYNPPRDEYEYGRKRAKDYSTSRQREHKDRKDDFRRRQSSSHYARERSSHKRDAYLFRRSNAGHSPHHRSGSRGWHSPKRSKRSSSHRSKHRKHASYRWHSEGKPEKSNKRPVLSSKRARNTSPPSPAAAASSEVIDRLSRLMELSKDVGTRAAQKLETTGGSNLLGVSESEFPGITDQQEESALVLSDGAELIDCDLQTNRSEAIVSKTKEIEHAYQQDCETFGMVVKMLIDKDPSLEKTIQFALRQALHEISERCIEELRDFITEYDASAQDFGEPF